MNIGELFVTLGVKGQGLGTLKDVAKTFANLPVDAAAAIAGMAGISLEMGKLAQEAMETAVAFQAFSNQTGLSWQQLQRWQIVAQQANVSAQAVATSVSTLERNLAEIRLGRGNIAPFQMLGISPQNDAFGVLSQLRQRIKGLNPATATNMISQMGLSPEMMNVLRLTDRQFSEFANHVHGLTERQEQDFLNARLAIVQLGQSFKYAMFGIISDFTEAIDKAKEFKGLMIALGAVAAAAAIYFFPITAALGALLLVLDDLAVYLTGGKSLTGVGVNGLKKLFKDLGEFIDLPVIAKIETLAHAIESLGTALVKLYSFKGVGNDALKQALDLISGKALLNPFNMSGLIAGKSGGGERNMNSIVNVHVNNDSGSLDAPGWDNVAHMIKKSVEAAHLQLNN